MPIYEYRCQVCHHEFEVIQKISDLPIQICPQCGKQSVEKLISQSGFQLTGTGWYLTDYKPKKSSAESDKQVNENKNEEKAEKKDVVDKKSGNDSDAS